MENQPILFLVGGARGERKICLDTLGSFLCHEAFIQLGVTVSCRLWPHWQTVVTESAFKAIPLCTR